jgi:NodT family efflux transporter outer membrane factor (OMF) lipoprotein
MNRSGVGWICTILLLAWLAAAGCAVGPDYRPPAAPAVKVYTEDPLPMETVSAPGVGGVAQVFSDGGDIPGQWWALFHSEALDRLIRRALASSPTVAAAEAALVEARESLRARTGTVYYPSLDGGLSASRSKVTGASFGQPGAFDSTFTLINASVSVSYALDLFGGGRRELEALRARVDSERFQLEGARLALSAGIVTTAVKEASLRERIRTTAEIIASQTEQLELVERKYQLGGIPRSDVLAQKTQLAQTKASLPPLEIELARTRHQLAALCGGFPDEKGVPRFELKRLRLPRALPVSLPSSLAHQRPDIRAAEALFHAATAQVGVETANLYPHITLSAGLGSNATRMADLFSSGSSVWNVGAGLLQPLFHGGELTARRRAAIAACDQALARYRETLIQAFRNVADVLQALEADARTLRAQAEAEAAARDAFELARKQFQAGATSYLILLNAQQQYQQARLLLVEARAARFSDSAALFQALGGGWWNRKEKNALPSISKESTCHEKADDTYYFEPPDADSPAGGT